MISILWMWMDIIARCEWMDRRGIPRPTRNPKSLCSKKHITTPIQTTGVPDIRFQFHHLAAKILCSAFSLFLISLFRRPFFSRVDAIQRNICVRNAPVQERWHSKRASDGLVFIT